MTINELKESGKKHRAASMLHLGMADQRELCRELKINRNLLRHWLRWDCRQRVLKWTKQRPMKENGKEKELRAQVVTCTPFIYPLMKKVLLFLLILFQAAVVSGQMHDALWLFGANSFFSNNPDWGTSVLDFNTEPPSAYEQEREMNLDVTVASICDSTGGLLFYTNGAWIANSAHEMMENGDSLNPGEITWNSYESGLTVAQSHIILPMPGNPGKYYLFHERIDYHDVLVLAVNPCYYTVIDMNQNNGLGMVLEKNVVVFDEPAKTFGTMTATKHANGRDWWVLFPEKAKNVFYRFLFSPNGVEDSQVLTISPPYPNNPPLGSNAFIAFSPDGSRLARYEIKHGLYLYGFDRCTGLLSDNPLFVPIPGTELGGGVAFSPNGRFVYMLSSTFVLQADTWAPDIAASLDTVAVWDGFIAPNNGLSTTFFVMQPGPDGRVYFNSNNSTPYLHYIDRPDLKGDSCRVVQHGIELPFNSIFTSPHFPNYRLGSLDGSPCDTLGLDNHPLAGFRYEVDTIEPLLVQFIDNSYYEPTGWSWDFGDGGTGTEVNPLHTFPAPGTYTVCLTVGNQYGSETACREVTVGTVGAGEAHQEGKVVLSPNPARDRVTVSVDGGLGSCAVVSVFNLYGQLVGRHDWPEGRGMCPFSTEGLPSGIYLVRLQAKDKIICSKKLVVAR